jgi:O-antigen/teichoic acid export membrane protein
LIIAAGGIVVTLVLWFAAGPIARDLLHTPQIAPYLALASLTVMLFAIDGFQTGAVIGFEALRGSALVTCAAAAISIPLTVALAAGCGLPGAVLGLVLSVALKCAAGRWLYERCLARDGIARFASHSGTEWRGLGGFALPAFLAVALVPPAHWLCQTLLVRTPDGHDQLALLAVGMQWFKAVLFLPVAAGRIILPVLTDALADGVAGHSQRILWASVGATALLVIPAALLISELAPWLLKLYGASFAPAATVLGVLVAAAALSALCAPFGQMLAARGEMWLGFGMNLLWATTYLAATALLLEHGAAGVALALLGAYAVHSLGVAVLASRRLRGSSTAPCGPISP